jgi:hypothetical protein
LLGQTVLSALGYTTQRELKENVVWELVRRHLELRGVRFLHIDEFQHLVQTRNPIEIQKVRDTLKGLMQSPGWPVWLILSGLPEIAGIVEGDTQIRRRCRFVRFEDIGLERDVKLVRRVISYYGNEKADLSVDCLATDEFISRLLHASLGQFGILVELIQDAIKRALTSPSTALRPDHFADAYAARTGCNGDQNVFTVTTDWTLIDVRATLHPRAGNLLEQTTRKPLRDRRGR